MKVQKLNWNYLNPCKTVPTINIENGLKSNQEFESVWISIGPIPFGLNENFQHMIPANAEKSVLRWTYKIS